MSAGIVKETVYDNSAIMQNAILLETLQFLTRIDNKIKGKLEQPEQLKFKIKLIRIRSRIYQ